MNVKDQVDTAIMLFSLMLVVLLASPAVASEPKRSTYLKEIKGAELNVDANRVAHVNCDAYEDHPMMRLGEYLPGATMKQYDMILGVSVLCPKAEGHLDPVVHVDGNQSDLSEWDDMVDGYLDFFGATAQCHLVDNGEVVWVTAPSRVVLECLDHDALLGENGHR